MYILDVLIIKLCKAVEWEVDGFFYSQCVIIYSLFGWNDFVSTVMLLNLIDCHSMHSRYVLLWDIVKVVRDDGLRLW